MCFCSIFFVSNVSKDLGVFLYNYSFYFHMIYLITKRCFFSFQPVLLYYSAFDDEVAEFPQDTAAEHPEITEDFLQCVLEEPPEAMVDAAPKPQLDGETPASQAQPGRPSASVVHGPYYYFYQGE